MRGHKTSVSPEDAFWGRLKEIATSRQSTCADLVAEIDQRRQQGNLSSAIRLFVLQFYQDRFRNDLKTSITPDFEHRHERT